MARAWRVAAATAGALAGAAVKLGGALAYGSRSLLADALTSAASLAALALSLYFYRESLRPPDSDHPYGHERLAIAPSLISGVLYSAVAGFMAGILALGGAYRVEAGAPVAAVVGGALYAVSIRASRGLGEAFRAYATLSSSEVLESAVVAVSSLAGASVSYLLDAAGALAILAYVAVEVSDNLRRALHFYTDTAAPRSVYEAVARELEREGLSAAA
nr:cation transporter [Desulfurococcales archaeon]